MKLFQRNTQKETQQDTKNATQPIPQDTKVTDEPLDNELTPEEAAQQWFTQQYGTDMPEVLRKLFRHWAFLEAKRQKVGEHILDENEQHKIQERIQLLQTRLTNIIQTIEDLQEEKKWIYQFDILLNNLNKQKAAYIDINKKYNAYLDEIKSLEQFEQFEAVQGNYERIKLIEKAWSDQRESSKQQLHKTTEQESAYQDSLKDVEQKEKEYTEAVSQVMNVQNLISEGYHLQANIKEYNLRINDLKEELEQTILTLNPLKQAILEAENEYKKAEATYAEKQQALQNMNALQKMIEKGEAILAKLKFLFSLKKRKEEIQSQLEQCLKKQSEENEKLNKLFTASKDVDAQIKTLQSELQVHQNSIVGMNSYTLQQRAMMLKSKIEQLRNANQLWDQISKGYALIDEKSLEITRMQMHNESLQSDIAQLEIEVSGMRKQCEELKYAYTLSKSQDVMQLRKDLQEGTNCCVCGATHHPYHSDTILEQSKLIGEMKTEYDQAATELKLKEKKLADLKHEQAIEEGRLDVSYQALIIYKKIQQNNVSNWSTFIPLDRSFNECSPSTNMEARRSMLQQLIEKTGLDTENAQKELDTFNFHQSNINALNERLTDKEQEKNSLIIRLNEINTACQVIAHHVDQLQQLMTRTNGIYSALYEEIDHTINLNNWYKTWKDSPENLYIYIQQQMDKYAQLKTDTITCRETCIKQRQAVELVKSQAQYVEQQKDFLKKELERLQESLNLQQDQITKNFPDGDVKAYSMKLLTQIQNIDQARTEVHHHNNELYGKVQFQKGYLQHINDCNKLLESQSANEHSELDLWIRKYNSQHSPIQYTEIEQTFKSQTDWNAVRQTIREITLKKMLAEARTEDASMALAAHQANSGSLDPEKENRTATLNSEIARMEHEETNIQTQIAELRARLTAHENSIQKLAACQDQLTMPK